MISKGCTVYNGSNEWHTLHSVCHEDICVNSNLNLELSHEYLKRHRLVPFAHEGNTLKVAMADPLQEYALNALHLKTGLTIEPYLCEEEEILRKIEMDYGLGSQSLGSLGDEFAADSLSNEDFDGLDELNSEAPAIRLFNFLVGRAANLGASDIHIEPQETELRVRL